MRSCSRGKNTCCANMRTYVQIPRTHVKCWVCVALTQALWGAETGRLRELTQQAAYSGPLLLILHVL